MVGSGGSALAQQLGNPDQLCIVSRQLNNSPAALSEFVGGRGYRARTLALTVRVLQEASQATVLSAQTRNFRVARESGAFGLRLRVHVVLQRSVDIHMAS